MDIQYEEIRISTHLRLQWQLALASGFAILGAVAFCKVMVFDVSGCGDGSRRELVSVQQCLP